jgi:hypothetical protein
MFAVGTRVTSPPAQIRTNDLVTAAGIFHRRQQGTERPTSAGEQPALQQNDVLAIAAVERIGPVLGLAGLVIILIIS